MNGPYSSLFILLPELNTFIHISISYVTIVTIGPFISLRSRSKDFLLILLQRQDACPWWSKLHGGWVDGAAFKVQLLGQVFRRFLFEGPKIGGDI